MTSVPETTPCHLAYGTHVAKPSKFLVVFFAAWVLGCWSSPTTDEGSSRSQKGTVAASSSSAVPSTAHPPSAAPAERCSSDPHAEAEGCACEHSAAVTSARAEERPGPKPGQVVRSVGRALTGKARASVAELLAEPTKYAGKTVRVQGDVIGMCHHRRAWFALRDGSPSNQAYVRVLTAPEFLVPEKSIGTKVTAEGTVELIQVPASMARHYAADHGLGSAGEARTPTQQLVIRATGAEFVGT